MPLHSLIVLFSSRCLSNGEKVLPVITHVLSTGRQSTRVRLAPSRVMYHAMTCWSAGNSAFGSLAFSCLLFKLKPAILANIKCFSQNKSAKIALFWIWQNIPFFKWRSFAFGVLTKNLFCLTTNPKYINVMWELCAKDVGKTAQKLKPMAVSHNLRNQHSPLCLNNQVWDPIWEPAWVWVLHTKFPFSYNLTSWHSLRLAPEATAAADDAFFDCLAG